MRNKLMVRTIAVASLLLPTGAAAYLALGSASAAVQATPLCEGAFVIAIPGGTWGTEKCVPYSGAVICSSGSNGIPELTVQDKVCVPAVVIDHVPTGGA